jgi:hypothetical protein
VDHFAEKARPLNELLKGAKKKQAKVVWTTECQTSFEQLKKSLYHGTKILVVPGF